MRPEGGFFLLKEVNTLRQAMIPWYKIQSTPEKPFGLMRVIRFVLVQHQFVDLMLLI